LQRESVTRTLDKKALTEVPKLQRAESDTQLAGVVIQGSIQQIQDSLSRADLQATPWSDAEELAVYKDDYLGAEARGRVSELPGATAAGVPLNLQAGADHQRAQPPGPGAGGKPTEFSADPAGFKSPESSDRPLPDRPLQLGRAAAASPAASPAAADARVLLFFRRIEAPLPAAPATDDAKPGN
jgi:hypothetical protein